MVDFQAHRTTQGELIERLGKERGNREALIYPARGLRMTFTDLAERSMALARGLVKQGVRPGDHVALWSDNRPDWIPLQFALARIGAVLVTANTGTAHDDIAYVLRQSRAVMVIATPGVQGTEYHDALTDLWATSQALPDLRQMVALEGAAPEGFLSLEDLVGSGLTVSKTGIKALTANTDPDQPASIQYTSGTTGSPKGVVLTHRNLVENAYATARLLEINDHDRVLLQVPLFHCFGCVVTMLGAYTHGVPLVALERFDPTAALQAIDVERCTVANGVPAMFRAILSHPELNSFDTTALRTGIVAGAACSEVLMHRIVDVMGCEGVVVAYGLTEASPCITCARPDDPIGERCSSVGRVLPGVEIRIVDPETEEDLPPGETGEVWARGPNVMKGYYAMPEETAAALTPDGWLRTGDLATRDASGLVRIAGRRGEMITRGGETVVPTEIENALRLHPAIDDAAVFGLPSEEWGEEVAAALVLAEGAAVPTVDTLRDFLQGSVSESVRPAHIAVLEELPHAPSGKVQRFRLQEICNLRSDT